VTARRPHSASLLPADLSTPTASRQSCGADAVGAPRASLDGGKTIANFWLAATTLFDFIRRAMPYTAPKSLTDQEVYDVTAYLLAANKLI
jgi:hypothetical protein